MIKLFRNIIAELRRRHDLKIKLEALTDPTFLDRALEGEQL